MSQVVCNVDGETSGSGATSDKKVAGHVDEDKSTVSQVVCNVDGDISDVSQVVCNVDGEMLGRIFAKE